MKRFYLRMEGVNLANFVYDTQDLSTVRGGGLLLLDAVTQIQTQFPILKPISTGASSGLFSFEADDGESVKQSVIDYLNKGDNLKHATFVVDIQQYDSEDKFIPDKELLIAKNRWQQMQSPSVAVPSIPAEKDKVACWIDGVRPALKPITDPETKETKYISTSVDIRKRYGSEKKKTLYEKIYKEVKRDKLGFDFVNHLDELTADASKGNLHHKMAVIYLDGNRFGKIRDRLCQTQEDEALFDKRVKDYRNKMLAELLNKMKDKSDWMNSNEYRIETLLWGGDELMWVVPAWKGWETLQFFYDCSKDWKFKIQKNGKEESRSLTHAGGMVFCHHNAPIYRIKDLAHKLSDVAKDKDKSKNLFAYQVLESFDHISHNFDDVRRKRSADGNPDTLILDGKNMENIRKKIKVLKDGEFPKNKLHDITKRLLNNQSADDLIKKVKESLRQSAAEAALNELSKACNGDNARWLHIADLWDYIV